MNQTALQPTFTVEALPSKATTTTNGNHTAYFVQSNGQSAFIDPICDSNSEAYCGEVKSSGTQLRYIFDTSTSEGDKPGSAGQQDNDTDNSTMGAAVGMGGIIPTVGCHIDLAILSQATIIRGPLPQDGSARSSKKGKGAPHFGFSATDAVDNQIFKLGDITITALIFNSPNNMNGAKPGRNTGGCCYLLTDGDGTPKIIFTGTASLAADLLGLRRDELVPHLLPAATLVYTTHGGTGPQRGNSLTTTPLIPEEGGPGLHVQATSSGEVVAVRVQEEEPRENYASAAAQGLSPAAISIGELTVASLLFLGNSSEEEKKKEEEPQHPNGSSASAVYSSTTLTVEELEEEKTPPLSRTTKHQALAVLGGAFLAFLGLFEGFAFAICGICDPRVFRDQMEFKSFLLVKLFFAAVGMSMLSQAFMSLVAKDSFTQSRFYTNLKVPYRRAVPGCFVLGIGMYVSGAGPTMTPAQLGSGVESAPFMFVGMAIGGLLFSLIEKTGILNSNIPTASSPAETSVDAKMGLPYAAVAIPGGLLLMVMAIVLEIFFPHSYDIEVRYRSSSYSPWALNPIFAGAVVGINQLPIRFLSGDGQGGSTGLMNLIGTLSCGVLSPNQRILRIEDSYQLCYMYIGTTLGAVAAAQSFSGYQAAEGYSILATLLGTCIMFFGARFAHGCTCGHGISGMSELSASSIVAGLTIFGGGILAGLVNVFLIEQI